MNTKKEKKRRFSLTWVDWVLLVLGVSVLLLGWRYLRGRQSVALPTVSVEYLLCLPSVKVEDFDGEVDGLISKSASVTTANGTASLGRVKRVWSEAHLTPTIKDGAILFVETPGRVDLYVFVEANAVMRQGDGLRVSDIRIAAGGTGDFRIGNFLANGAKVVSVRKGALLS